MVDEKNVTQSLPKGYKQTEIGVIPEDWNVEEIGDVATIYRGKFTPRPRNNPIYYGGTIPFVQTGDVTKCNGVIREYSQSLNEKGLEVSKLFNKGTILMTIAANIGYSGILEIDMACPDSLIGINGIRCDNRFLNYYFQWKRILIEELSTSGAQKNLNIELFRPFQIPLPPTKAEQEAIANVLSDIDTLITNLDALIAKKKAIKKGAMQQLLTPPSKGGKRLPGFSGEWVEKSLGEVCEMASGGTPLTTIPEYYNGKIPWISSGELNKTRINETSSFISKKGLENSSARLVKKGTLLFAMYGATAGISAITNIEGAINQAVLAIMPFSFSSEFLFQYLVLNKSNIIETFTQGGQPNLSGHIVKKLKINFPPTLEEQEAVATILSDMDTEIEALEAKKEKYSQLKQGMAQELLTGKTRLV